MARECTLTEKLGNLVLESRKSLKGHDVLTVASASFISFSLFLMDTNTLKVGVASFSAGALALTGIATGTAQDFAGMIWGSQHTETAAVVQNHDDGDESSIAVGAKSKTEAKAHTESDDGDSSFSTHAKNDLAAGVKASRSDDNDRSSLQIGVASHTDARVDARDSDDHSDHHSSSSSTTSSAPMSSSSSSSSSTGNTSSSSSSMSNSSSSVSAGAQHSASASAHGNYDDEDEGLLDGLFDIFGNDDHDNGHHSNNDNDSLLDDLDLGL